MTRTSESQMLREVQGSTILSSLAKKVTTVSVFMIFTLTAPGCGKSNFSSDGSPTPAVERAGKETTDPNTVPAGGKPDTTLPPPTAGSGNGKPGNDGGINITPGGTSDQQAIDKCLAAWGQHPFGASTTHYRKISATVQVLGFGPAVKDDHPTGQPELVLISAAVGVLSQSSMQLLNPNGWYCLKVDVNVLNNTVIDLACQAHLADSRVNVAVLSNSQPAGVVGVHVLSDVKVNRRPGC